MILTSEQAYKYLLKAGMQNDGKWIQHSLYVGQAAGMLASQMDGLVSIDNVIAMGYVHDIGRMFGNMKMNHALRGYYFLKDEGYEEAAKVCLTHSFPVQDIETVTGLWDCSEEDYIFLKEYISSCQYDYYDKLIQFCDNIATADGITAIEVRLIDIVMRYGFDNKNTINRWEKCFGLKKEIESLMGKTVEDVLGLKTMVSINVEDECNGKNSTYSGSHGRRCGQGNKRYLCKQQ